MFDRAHATRTRLQFNIPSEQHAITFHTRSTPALAERQKNPDGGPAGVQTTDLWYGRRAHYRWATDAFDNYLRKWLFWMVLKETFIYIKRIKNPSIPYLGGGACFVGLRRDDAGFFFTGDVAFLRSPRPSPLPLPPSTAVMSSSSYSTLTEWSLERDLSTVTTRIFSPDRSTVRESSRVPDHVRGRILHSPPPANYKRCNSLVI